MTLRMRMLTSALLLVLTVAIGIATNIVTDMFTWAWAAALLTLVLGAVTVQITASRLEARTAESSVDPGSTVQQALAVSGGTVYNAGRDVVVGVSGRSLSIMLASMAAVAVVVFLLAVTVAGVGNGVGQDASPSEGTEPKNQALSGPDPFLYVILDGGVRLARKQTCDGLFGLCLGQPIRLAIDAFGVTEDVGSPQSGGPGITCHRWRPKRLDNVGVCESGGAIRSVRYDSLSSTGLVLALPHDQMIRFPGDLNTQAESITESLRGELFSSTFLHGDGESIFTMDWFLPSEAEGTPSTHLWVLARLAATYPSKDEMRPCAGEEEIYYPYREILRVGKEATVSTVQVSTTEPEDLEGPKVCR